MTIMRSPFYTFVFSYLIFFLFLSLCFGSVKSEDFYTPSSENPTKESGQMLSLQAIVDSIAQLEQAIKERQESLKSPSIPETERTEMESDINNLASQIKTLEQNFMVIATGVDMSLFEKQPSQKFEWSEELKSIFKPIFEDIQKMIAGPRDIDRLQREVNDAKRQLDAVKIAQDNLQELIKIIADKKLKAKLLEIEKQWIIRNQQIKTKSAIATEQLRQKLEGKKSFSEKVQELFLIFFKSRGWNFFLALFAFLCVWIILWKLHGRIKNIIFFHKISHKFSIKLFDLIYHVFTIFLAVLALLSILYFAGDWVLITLVVIASLGLIWASRTTIPRFWEQAKLLLDMGAVREGERVVYNGLPWLVKSIGFYTSLVNKELIGGTIRLPLRYLLDLHSRPWQDEEPWFPSKEGDWVLLSDETHGRIVTQSSEIVELVLLGGSHKTYSTVDFLAHNPERLCPNFRVKISFGFDYKHQPLITDKIPEQLETMLKEKLSTDGYGENIKNIKVEFCEAGASSLNLMILADFSGKVADKYYVLQRTVQRICVDACNQYNWVIPFTQLTVYMQSPEDYHIPKLTPIERIDASKG